MERRRNICRLFNVVEKSGTWIDYKRSLTDYNKALRQAKRQSWKRQCEEIVQAPECARLQKILSKDVQSAISSIRLYNGQYTKTENETLEELLRVHFPSSKIIIEPSDGWDDLQLEFPKWNVSTPTISPSSHIRHTPVHLTYICSSSFPTSKSSSS